MRKTWPRKINQIACAVIKLAIEFGSASIAHALYIMFELIQRVVMSNSLRLK